MELPCMRAQEFYIFTVLGEKDGRDVTARGAVQAWGGMRAVRATAPTQTQHPKPSHNSVGVGRTLTGAVLAFLTAKKIT